MSKTLTSSLTSKSLPPFCVQAAGLVGKAATIAESKKRTKYRPAVVTLAILETHGRMGSTLKAFLAKITPEDQQARVTWSQEAMRRISCPPTCPAPRPLCLLLAPCSTLVTSRLVTFSARSGLPAQRSWLYPGFDSCFPWSSHSIVLWPCPTLWRCWLRQEGVLLHCVRLRSCGDLFF